MPYYKRSRFVPVDEYVLKLSEELRMPQSTLPEKESFSGKDPVIIEETGLMGRVSVTVIWDEWKDLSGEARGHVIMRAYEEVLGKEFSSRIGLAMGLTTAQKHLISDWADTA